MPDVPLDGYPYFRDRSGNGMGVVDVPHKVLPVSKGGTGIDSYAIGDLLVANTTTTLSRLDAEPVGKVLISKGEDVMPDWGGVPVAGFSGTLTPANGGTGTSVVFTQGSIVFAGVSGNYAEDNNNLNWNDTSNTLGIGGPAVVNKAVAVRRSLTGGAIGYGVAVDGTVLNDVTTAGLSYYSGPSTQATPFTVNQYTHYQADGVIKGAGSVINEQKGFSAAPNMTAAGTNWGFFGNLPAGANNWNFYANGTAKNFFQGATSVGNDPVLPMEVATKQYVDTKTSGSVPLMTQGSIPFADATGNLIQDNPNLNYNDAANTLGVGVTAFPNVKLAVGGNLTGATTSIGVYLPVTVQSDATVEALLVRTNLNTQAAAFTTGAIKHFSANQAGLFGAGSAATIQAGFHANSSLQGGVSNYGFFGEIPAGTNRWNLYMAGTADNYMAGALGVGSNSLAGYKVRVGGNIAGATTSYSFANTGTVQSSVTVGAYGYFSGPFTQAAAFTMGYYAHFDAEEINRGAGSIVTNEYGFVSNIAAGSGKYNFYAAGSADNYMAGALGLGNNVALTNYKLRVNWSPSASANMAGIASEATLQSTVTGSYQGFLTTIATQAAAFNVGVMTHYQANQGSLGAGSSIGTQIGFGAGSSMIGGTTNVGFYGDIPAGTNRWNFYAPGSAANHMAGKLGIGTAGIANEKVVVGGPSTGGTNMIAYAAKQQIQSDVTFNNISFYSLPTTVNGLAMANVQHFVADAVTHGSGSSAAVHYGFVVGGAFNVGGTTNYGFYGGCTAGVNNYNLHLVGNAQNYMNGNTGIGGGPLTNATLRTVSSGTSRSIVSEHSLGGNNAEWMRTDGGGWHAFYWAGVNCGYIATVTANTCLYSTSSDVRLKENIVDASSAGDVIDAIKVVAYDWKQDSHHVDYGLIAQDLHPLFPDAVSVGTDELTEGREEILPTEEVLDEEGRLVTPATPGQAAIPGGHLATPWGIDYGKLVPLLIKEIQELRTRVAQLEAA